jgi:hypothetical protein
VQVLSGTIIRRQTLYDELDFRAVVQEDAHPGHVADSRPLHMSTMFTHVSRRLGEPGDGTDQRCNPQRTAGGTPTLDRFALPVVW